MPHDDPKGPSTVKSCINPFMCHSLHIPHGTFGEQTRAYTNTHALTPAEGYSPDERDHLLHYVPAEGDDHKQFLYDKEETHRKSESVTEP